MSKASKLIYFTAKSQEHDINIKLRNILKWLKSGHEVRVRIDGSSERRKAMDNIYFQIERDAKQNALFMQKVVKPDSIKFIMKPIGSAGISETNSVEPHAPPIAQTENLTAENLLSDEFEKELEKQLSTERPKRK